MKRKIGLIVFIIGLFLGSMPVNAGIYDIDGDGIPGVRGEDYDIVTVYEEAPIHNRDILQSSISVRPMALLGYSVRNPKYVGICGPYPAPPGGEVSGMPGVTLNLSTSVSLLSSVGTSLGIGVNDVGVSIGVQIQMSYTFQISGTWTVPSTYNGKNVTRAVFSGRPYSKAYTYDFYYLGLKTGSGAAEIPWGISYSYIYFY